MSPDDGYGAGRRISDVTRPLAMLGGCTQWEAVLRSGLMSKREKEDQTTRQIVCTELGGSAA
jgi:hypothetical protein